MPDFVPKDAHQTGGITTLDTVRHTSFQALESRMCEVKRDRDTGYTVGRKPFVRKPEVRRELDIACGELSVNASQRAPQDRASRCPESQVAEAQSQQLRIAVTGPLRRPAGHDSGSGFQPHQDVGE